jgi:hypothetical protein
VDESEGNGLRDLIGDHPDEPETPLEAKARRSSTGRLAWATVGELETTNEVLKRLAQAVEKVGAAQAQTAEHVASLADTQKSLAEGQAHLAEAQTEIREWLQGRPLGDGRFSEGFFKQVDELKRQVELGNKILADRAATGNRRLTQIASLIAAFGGLSGLGLLAKVVYDVITHRPLPF